MRVLIVDDEPSLVELQKELLEAEGFTVSIAFSGNNASEILNEQEQDVILSDVRMPNGNGIYLLEESRKFCDTPFVLLSGYTDITEDEALAKGAAALLPKPVRLNNLIHTIRSQARQ